MVVDAADLGNIDSAGLLRQRLDAQRIDIDILVNNAAFGIGGPFIANDPQQLRAMLQLDIVAMTELTHVFGNRMAERGHGRILLVGSIAAYQPTPGMAAYGAGKAYMLSLGESLNVELGPAVNVTVLSPGLMDTGFLDIAGYVPTPAARRTMLSPSAVAHIGIQAMLSGKSSVVAGRFNRMLTLATRFFSRHVQAKMGAYLT